MALFWLPVSGSKGQSFGESPLLTSGEAVKIKFPGFPHWFCFSGSSLREPKWKNSAPGWARHGNSIKGSALPLTTAPTKLNNPSFLHLGSTRDVGFVCSVLMEHKRSSEHIPSNAAAPVPL